MKITDLSLMKYSKLFKKHMLNNIQKWRILGEELFEIQKIKFNILSHLHLV